MEISATENSLDHIPSQTQPYTGPSSNNLNLNDAERVRYQVQNKTCTPNPSSLMLDAL